LLRQQDQLRVGEAHLDNAQVQVGREERGQGHAEGAGCLGLKPLDPGGGPLGHFPRGPAVHGDGGSRRPFHGLATQPLQHRRPLCLQQLQQSSGPDVRVPRGRLEGGLLSAADQLCPLRCQRLIQRLQAAPHGRSQQGGVLGRVAGQPVDHGGEPGAPFGQFLGRQAGRAPLQLQRQLQGPKAPGGRASGRVGHHRCPLLAQEPGQVRTKAPQPVRVANPRSGRQRIDRSWPVGQDLADHPLGEAHRPIQLIDG